MSTYGISVDMQSKLIDSICFGKCKKINFGGFYVGDYLFVPCLHSDCEYVESEIDAGDHEGEKIIIRKLKED